MHPIRRSFEVPLLFFPCKARFLTAASSSRGFLLLRFAGHLAPIVAYPGQSALFLNLSTGVSSRHVPENLLTSGPEICFGDRIRSSTRSKTHTHTHIHTYTHTHTHTRTHMSIVNLHSSSMSAQDRSLITITRGFSRFAELGHSLVLTVPPQQSTEGRESGSIPR